VLDVVSGREDPRPVMAVAVDDRGVIRLTWATGLHITEQLASDAMDLVDRVNGGAERPLLVDMTGTATLSRPARMAFSRKCSASRIALLGKSPVDRVIANFALGVSAVPVPTRFFTSEPGAIAWLCRGDAGI
jgi:hypothetical protein